MKVILYHIADIHIHDSRRDEYRSVFVSLFDAISRNNAAYGSHRKYVVIVGDIFDLKTKLTPNNITDFFFLVDGLLNICDYIVTMPGNHDVNLNNPEAVDLISPLVNKYDRLIHCVDTGSYIIDGMVFNVLSPAEPFALYPYIVGSEFNVYMAHENIHGAIHNGFSLSGRIMQTELAKYRIAIFGHIHELIWIQSNGAYSGSLIQQNIGESLTKGMIVWEINDTVTTRKFISIPNKYGYIKYSLSTTLAINYNPIVQCDSVLPTRPYKISIEVDDAPSEMVQKLVDECQSKYSIMPTVYPKVNRVVSACVDLSHENEQKNMILSQLEHNAVPKHIQEAIIDIHHKNYKSQEVGIPSNRTWSIKYLEWSNVFCYGPNNVINFDMFPSCISGIVADNKSGKSSVIDIIIYTLFNHLLRGDTKNIINKRCDHAHVRIIFSAGEPLSTHEIVRTFDKVKSSIKYTVNGVNCTDERVDNVYRRIEGVIGTFSDFISISAITQDRVDDFIHMTNQKRVDFLKVILGLDVLEKQLESAKILKKELVDKRSVYNVRPVCELTSSIREINESIQTILDQKNKAASIVELTQDVMPQIPSGDIDAISSCISNLNHRLDSLPPFEHTNKSTEELIIERNVLSHVTVPSQSDYNIVSNKSIPGSPRSPRSPRVSIHDLKTKKAVLESIIRDYTMDTIKDSLQKYGKYKNKATPLISEDDIDAQIDSYTQELRDISVLYSESFDKYVSIVEKPKASLINDLKIVKEINNIRSSLKQPFDIDACIKALDTRTSSSIIEKINEERTILTSIDAQIRDTLNSISTTQKSYNVYMEQYHEYTDKSILESDIVILKKINSLKAKIMVSVRDTDQLNNIISNTGCSANIQLEIDTVRRRILSVNPTYRHMVAKLSYNKACSECKHNQECIQQLNVDCVDDVNEEQKHLDSLISKKILICKLESELDASRENDKIRASINNLNDRIQYKGVDVEYIYGNHDTILHNIDIHNTLVSLNKTHISLLARRQNVDESINRLSIELAEVKQLENDIDTHGRMKALEQCIDQTDALPVHELEYVIFNYENIRNNKALKTKLTRITNSIAQLREYKNVYTYIHLKKKYDSYIEYNEVLKHISVREYRDSLSKIKHYESSMQRLHNISTEIDYRNITTILEEKRSLLAKTREDHEQYKRDIEMYKQYKLNIGIVSECEHRINTLSSTLKSLNSELEKSKEQEELDVRIRVYTEYIKTMDSKTGFPLKIISTSCTKITQYANSILNELCDFTIQFDFKFKQKTSTVSLQVVDSGMNCVPISMGSGYQQFIISIALRNAFIQLTRKPISDMLFIDEGFTALDSKNLTKIIEIIPTFKILYNRILVISHLDEIKAVIEYPIYITIKDNFSNISCGVDPASPPTTVANTVIYDCIQCKFSTKSKARFDIHVRSKKHMQHSKMI